MQFKDYFIRKFLVILFAATALSLYNEQISADSPDVIQGKVVAIADGDTLTILMNKKQYKIRLAEIDTPESGQPYGSKAKKVLSDLVFRKTVAAEVQDIDRYGRYVARLYVGDLDINAELVKRGVAWVYREYSTDDSFYDYEKTAKENQLGIWGLPESERVPPWEWRKGAGHFDKDELLEMYVDQINQ